MRLSRRFGSSASSRETADAVSLVLDVPEHCSAQFRYQAGQFLTLRVTVAGRELRRCYSMSSSPGDDDLRITVKRDPRRVVSNWLNDTAAEGAEIHAAPPEGRFVLAATSDDDRGRLRGRQRDHADHVAGPYGAGDPSPRACGCSTPTAAADSVIFADALARLGRAASRPVRRCIHHFDDEQRCGHARRPDRVFVPALGDAEYFICGPTPFMDTVESAVLAAGVPAGTRAPRAVSGGAGRRPTASTRSTQA